MHGNGEFMMEANRIDMFGVPHWNEWEKPLPEHCYFQAGVGTIDSIRVRRTLPGLLEYGLQFDGDTKDDIHWFTFSGSYEVEWA
jgi:hypothetical protein